MENTAPVIEPSHAKIPRINPKLLILCVLVLVAATFIIGLQSGTDNTIPNEDKTQEAKQTIAPTPSVSEFVAGQLLVKFKDGVSDAVITNRLQTYNATIKGKIEGINVTIVSVPKGQEEVIRKQLAEEEIVEYAEPDYVLTTQFVPNDTEFAKQYGIVNTGQIVNNRQGVVDADTDLDRAWDISKGTGVKIAILDSGIDVNHPDLAAKIVAQRDFTGTSIIDTYGHGTHVAGIAGAVTNNAQGMAGACPDCQLMIGKVLTTNVVGSISTLTPGIIWATDNGAKVISMSTGIIPLPGNINTLETAVNYAWTRNVVVVAAAGNFNLNIKIYPAALPNVVSVGATNNIDTKASFSSFGTWVKIVAPGQDIFSTFPSVPTVDRPLSYGLNSGTSMATPLVAGTAGLLWASPFGTSNTAVVQRLLSTADPIPGTGTQWQFGRLNAARALGAPEPSTVPSIVPSIIPRPSVVIPTFFCGGSTNSICPSPIPSVPGTTRGPSAVPPSRAPSAAPSVSISISPQPCEDTTSSIAGNKGKSKHKEHKGGVSGFMEALMKFFTEFIDLLLKLLGNGQGPTPTPTPTPSVDPSTGPQPSGDPCQPSGEPEPSDKQDEKDDDKDDKDDNEPSGAVPSTPNSRPSTPIPSGTTETPSNNPLPSQNPCTTSSASVTTAAKQSKHAKRKLGALRKLVRQITKAANNENTKRVENLMERLTKLLAKWFNSANPLPGPTPSSTVIPSVGPTRGNDPCISAAPSVSVAPSNVPSSQPSPQPSESPVFRAFSSSSYWNTPMPADAPIDPSNATWIADSLSKSGSHLQFTGAPDGSQPFAQPIYWAKVTDKLYTITASGITATIHIPAGATAATGSDGQIVIFDISTNQVVGIHRAIYNATTDTWSTASGIDRYYLDSNGLSNNVAGSDNPNNFGHRGIPAPIRAIRVDEVKAGAIDHRLECFWHATFDQHYWPMAGHESGKGGVVPEGVVARIKPSVNLDSKGLNPSEKVIALALQKYGCMVGDNSGSNSRIKLERDPASWQTLGVTTDSLAQISWNEWEFIKGGYDPVTKTIK